MSSSTPVQKSAAEYLSKEAYQEYVSKQYADLRGLGTGFDFSDVSRKMPRRMQFEEVGTPGLRIYSGFLEEEFLPELRGHMAARVYQEMRYNDPTVGAMLYVMENLIQNATLSVLTDDTSQEGLKARELVESCFNDMAMPWEHVLSEILTFLPFGYSWMEVTMKHRRGSNLDPMKASKYSDGMIGWGKMALRGQDTTYRWHMDEAMNVRALEQLPPPHFINTVIPWEKSLHFLVRPYKSNPEGTSLLRNAYRPYFFMKRIEEIEAIAVERELNGMPVLQPPEGYNLWNQNDPDSAALLSRAETLVRNIRQDQHQGVVLPFGWVLTLLSASGQRSLDTSIIINRYAQRVATVVLADMLLIGQEKVGSFALVAAKVSLFSKALRSIANIIAGVINRYGIPRLLKMNGMSIDNPPYVKFGPIDTPDLKSLSEYVNKLVGNNVLTPDQSLERHLREIASMPQADPVEETYPAEGLVNDPDDDTEDPTTENLGPRPGPGADAFSDKPTKPGKPAPGEKEIFPPEGGEQA
jgi:hypothetical protein